MAHANVKTELVLEAKLPYVAQEFHVTVCDEEHFSAERDRLLSYKSEAIFIESETPEPGEVDDWAVVNEGLVTILNDKLHRLGTVPTDADRAKFLRQVLIWHLEGQNLLGKLRKLSPIVHERAFKAKSHYEKLLTSLQMSSSDSAEIFQSTLKEFLIALREVVKSLSTLNAMTLTHEAVADWLLRCPLDFPNRRNNG